MSREMRLWIILVISVLGGLGPELWAAPGKAPLGKKELALLSEAHEMSLAIWVKVLGKPPLKFIPIKEADGRKYVGDWEGRWHEPTAEDKVGMNLVLKENGSWVSRGVGLEEEDDRFERKGRWYLHRGAIQLWDGPVGEDHEGGSFLFVENDELYMMFMQIKEGRVKLTRRKGKK